jgi:hypothetical protein
MRNGGLLACFWIVLPEGHDYGGLLNRRGASVHLYGYGE